MLIPLPRGPIGIKISSVLQNITLTSLVTEERMNEQTDGRTGREHYAFACPSALVEISQYSTVVLTVVRVMIAEYRKSGIWGYRSSLTPEPVELK